MKVAVVLLVSLGLVMSNPQHSLEEVITMVIADTDTDMDGFISEAEFRTELLAKWDTDVPSDEVVSKHDFVQQWCATYGDNHHDASTFFDNMDSFFPYGELNQFDLAFHLSTLDPDGDGRVSIADFRAFILANHPCGQHGHFDCPAAR